MNGVSALHDTCHLNVGSELKLLLLDGVLLSLGVDNPLSDFRETGKMYPTTAHTRAE